MDRRRCKIVATIGPASEAPERLRQLIDGGADVIRLNFSHGKGEEHAERVKRIRKIEELLRKPVAIIGDLQGPKVRVGALEGESISLKFGAEFTLKLADTSAEPDVAPVPHPEFFAALSAGEEVKFDDGMISATVLKATKTEARCKVTAPGELKPRKGINLPGAELPISALTDKDKEDLETAAEAGVDYIALSFVQRPADLDEARARIAGRTRLLAKIEKRSAVEHLAAIVERSDAVMVARGDLGVEIPFEEVPIVQRRIVRACREAGKPVIVATHMLQSMVESSTPTRAEASDVATAVYLGVDAVMLSAETAVGRHPMSAIAIMDRVIRAVERDEDYWLHLPPILPTDRKGEAAAIAAAATEAVRSHECGGLAAFTQSGATAFALARERPRENIIAVTTSARAARAASLCWGVRAVVMSEVKSFEDVMAQTRELAASSGLFDKGEPIALVAGLPIGTKGRTNVLHLLDPPES